MDDDGDQTPKTPFWIQTTTNVRRIELYRRRASSLFFNSGVLIIFLLIFAILSMLFIIPSIISFTSHFLKPNLVKKSWDSINLVLVLFALAFGFLSRNINNDNDNKSRFENGFNRSGSDLSIGAPVTSPIVSTPNQWYDFPEQPISGLRRHRSTSSYPDLRELSPPWNHRVEQPPWRFSDDTHLNNNRVMNYDRYYFRREYDFGLKDVNFDPVVDLDKDSYAPPLQPPVIEEESQSPPPQLLSPASPPPETPAPEVIRTYHSVGKDEGVNKVSILEVNEVLLPEVEIESPGKQDFEQREEMVVRERTKRDRRRARSSEPRKMVSKSNDFTPGPSSPPAISPEFQDVEQKTSKSERKRTGANATKEFFTSFYLKKKKKRQRQRSVDNLDILLHRSQPPVKIQLPPPSQPPPPPPPPPPSILNNLFTSKKERRKKTPSSSTPPVPPPPPKTARAQKPTITAARGPKTITRVSPFVTEKPKAPVKMKFLIDDSSSGGESPMSRIPPPPPMPPFKMPDWKFAVEGDYVRVQSTLSSGSVSPDGDEAQSPSYAVASPVFCPSPDVNTKADKFIEKFRAGLKLEKINSFNQNRMSNLGPGPGPSRSYRY